ncbi:MAG: D-tyrosyl-tRNA(Tyr) deacylase [Caldilineae bacterium]|nr:MAG: D-tyrosyl-tRNA(Tyr) deacylase [Caldilineae bacterium]
MRLVIQRVNQASVTVNGEVVGAIGRGYLVLVGVTHGDGVEQAEWLARKVAGLRLFDDAQGLTNLSLADVDGEVLVVSQFTLYADARKGRRPSFTHAAPPEVAEPLVEEFVNRLRRRGVRVATGVFRAHMEVALVNDGPVTLILEKS